MENPTNIVRSWNLQSSFQSGPIDDDRLLPATFTRIRTNHVNTWRSEAVSTQLDWSAQRFSLYLPSRPPAGSASRRTAPRTPTATRAATS